MTGSSLETKRLYWVPVSALGSFRFTVCAVILLGCGPKQDAVYASYAEGARHAQSQGQYRLAATRWESAATGAVLPRNKDEALYRSAMNLLRVGDTRGGERQLQQLAAKRPPGPRSARAAFDLAFMEFKRDPSAGVRSLERAVLLHPRGSSAARGLRTIAAHKAASNPLHAISFLRAIERRARGSQANELAEAAGYETARQLDASGDPGAALEVYQRTVRRYPYPSGVLWDNALLASAQIQVRLERYRDAIKSLEFLLGHKEEAFFLGSYDRHYAQAEWRIAEIFQLHLGLPEQAAKRFMAMAQRYPFSHLRDDALWKAAVIWNSLEITDRACSAVSELRTIVPRSRYQRCSHLACNTAPTQEKCPDYILQLTREIERCVRDAPDRG